MTGTLPLHILLVEDNPTEILILEEAFAVLNGGRFRLDHVPRLDAALAQLKLKRYSVVLLDLGLPDSQGIETFARLHASVPDIPVLVLTALDDEAAGIRAMQAGAQDYLIKKNVDGPLLGRSVRYAVERHHFMHELGRSRDQLRGLAVKLEAVREAERTHLSREVHDEIGQTLTGLKMDMRWIAKKLDGLPATDATLAAVREKANEAGHIIDEAIANVQRIAIELRPGALDYLGLAAAIRDEAARFEQRTGIRVAASLPDELPMMENVIATAFFRIFQELMTNIARHAKASNVEVTLVQAGLSVTLTVNDDGRGITEEEIARSTSLGLLSIRERAIALNGKIDLNGVAGQGTSTKVTIPYGLN